MQWRHLDTCQLETLLKADVPRVECSKHGVHTMQGAVGKVRVAEYQA